MSFFRSFPTYVTILSVFLFSSHSLHLGLQFHMHVAAWVLPQLTDTLFTLNICQIPFLCFMLIVYQCGFSFTAFCICSIQFAVNCILYFAVWTIHLHFSDSHFCVLNSGSWSLPMIQLTVTWSRTISQGSKLCLLLLISHCLIAKSKNCFLTYFSISVCFRWEDKLVPAILSGWKWKSLKFLSCDFVNLTTVKLFIGLFLSINKNDMFYLYSSLKFM